MFNLLLAIKWLALRNNRFLVQARLIALCIGGLSAVMSKCLWSGWENFSLSLLFYESHIFVKENPGRKKTQWLLSEIFITHNISNHIIKHYIYVLLRSWIVILNFAVDVIDNIPVFQQKFWILEMMLTKLFTLVN